MKFLGHILCPKDGYTYITNPKKVKIYLALDSAKFLTEVVCNKCGTIVGGEIEKDAVVNFISYGAKVIHYGKKFPKLTEEMIQEWDIEGEINSFVNINQERS